MSLSAINKSLFVGFLYLLPISSIETRVTTAEGRKLAIAAIREGQVRRPGVTIELDREQSNCAVYHAYRDDPSRTLAFTIGYWSVDLSTAEVWDDTRERRITNPQIDSLQRAIRNRLHVTTDEISSARSHPCYERYSQ